MSIPPSGVSPPARMMDAKQRHPRMSLAIRFIRRVELGFTGDNHSVGLLVEPCGVDPSVFETSSFISIDLVSFKNRKESRTRSGFPKTDLCLLAIRILLGMVS